MLFLMDILQHPRLVIQIMNIGHLKTPKSTYKVSIIILLLHIIRKRKLTDSFRSFSIRLIVRYYRKFEVLTFD